MVISTEFFIFIASILLFFSVLIGNAGHRFGAPFLLIFLLIGLLVGSDGLGIQFDSPRIAQSIGIVALNIILFSGGLDTSTSEIKPVIKEGVFLATFGVLLTALLTGVFIFWLTNNFFCTVTFTLYESLLLASVMSSTDSASVFSILRSRGLSLKQNLRPLLELESGSNDPMAYMLTIVFIQLIQTPDFSIGYAILMFFTQLILGALAGLILGKLAVKLINRINLGNDALYSVMLLTIMFFLFGFTDFIGGNGYLAVYVGGLFIGNSRFVHKRSTLRFFDGLSWLFQIIMFLTLGLLVNPSELLPIAGVGILVGFFMIIVSRPLSVFLSLLPFRKLSFKGRLYVSWVGLRGAVPIIFATYPWIAGLPHAKMIFNIVFFITILSLVIQGTSVGVLAKLLGLSKKTTPQKRLKEFDVEFSDEIKSTMNEISVEEEFLCKGCRLMDLNIPDKTLIVMVKRENKYFVPRGNTELQVGDKLLVITDNEKTLDETYMFMRNNK